MFSILMAISWMSLTLLVISGWQQIQFQFCLVEGEGCLSPLLLTFFFFFNFQSQQCYKKRLAVRHKLLLLRYGLAFQSADPEKMEVFDGIGWMKQPMWEMCISGPVVVCLSPSSVYCSVHQSACLCVSSWSICPSVCMSGYILLESWELSVAAL